MILITGIAEAVCDDPEIYPAEPTMKYCINETLHYVYQVSINDSINTTQCIKAIDKTCSYGCNNMTSECNMFNDEQTIVPKIISVLMLIIGLGVIAILIVKGVIK